LDSNGNAVIDVGGLEARRVANLDELNDWLYTLEWVSSAPEAIDDRLAAFESSRGTWMIFADRSGVADALEHYLEDRDQRCVTIRPGSVADASQLRQLLRDAVTKYAPCRGVVFLWPLDSPIGDTLETFNAANELGCASLLNLVQALAQTGWRDAPRLCLVTRGATGTSPAQSPLWGFARTLAVEHPEFRCVRFDLSDTGRREEVAQLCDACWSEDNEQEVAWRDGVKHVSRLVRTRLRSAPAFRVRSESAYLITGAFGGIGQAVARWLADRGARHLILTGSREPSGIAQQTIDELKASGVRVLTASADVGRFDDLERVFKLADAEALDLRGVFHCAGRLDDGILLKLTAERMKRVMEPKVAGAWNLHLLTRDRKLDYFVLFSSAAALLGSPGQANYSAANAFLDALARHRCGLGLPAMSINWGPWAEIGLAAGQANRGQRLAVQGVGSLTPKQGIRALESLMEQALAGVAVIPFDLRQWREFYPALANASLFAELIKETGDAASTAASPQLTELLRDVDSGDRRAVVLRHITEQIAAVMRLDVSRIPAQTSLGNLGLDSLMGLEIRNRLERSSGLTLSATLVWTYPTVAALADFLEASLWPASEAVTPKSVATAASAGVDMSELDELSEEEARRMLQEELASLAGELEEEI
jgi:myxalamid-type polyketide synthase MxaE and MxaD